MDLGDAEIVGIESLLREYSWWWGRRVRAGGGMSLLVVFKLETASGRTTLNALSSSAL